MAHLGRTAARAENADLPKVLVIESYHEGMPWTDSLTRGLGTALRDDADLYFTHLDAKRFPGAETRPGYEAYLTQLAHDTRPAVIVATDDTAYRFALGWRARTDPGVPLVFGGVNYWSGPRPAGVSGVLESFDFPGTLALALQLHPACRRVVIVNDHSPTGLANQAAIDQTGFDLGGRTLLRLGQGTFAETERALDQLNPIDDVVILLSWNLDSTDATRSYETAIARARAHCRAPIYGVWDFYFGAGIVGGSLLSGETHGGEIAALVRQVLHGRDVDSLPIVTHCRTQVQLDARELDRFGIFPSRWPKTATIRFLPPSLVRDRPVLVGSVVAVLLLQGVTITWLVLARASRRRAVAQLRATEAAQRRILNSIHDGLISTDAQARIVRMNPMAERLTGWREAEAAGRPLAEVLPLRQLDSPDALPDPVAAVVRGGAGHGLQRAQLADRQGEKRILAFSVAPILDPSGRTDGAVLAFHDITDLRRLEEQFRQAQKMESIGLLAGGVAHDFNNLLQVIYGNLHFMQDPTSTAEESAGCCREIEGAARRASELTRQLLAFGRRQKLAPQELDLVPLTENMLKLIRRIIGVNIDVTFAAPAGAFLVKADPSQLEQVILNLCVNARDAMPRGGRLELALAHAEFTAGDSRHAPWVQPGRYAVLSVTDTGAGMDRETQARIFEPFFTTKAAGHGTGLGLSVVQGVVQQHEGLINVYSEPGVGTTFRVYLPAHVPEGTRTTEAAPLPARPASVSHTTILLADDDTATRLVTCSILRRHGYTVIPVSDGAEACAAAAAHEGPIHVAILDVMMPRLGGPEAARRLSVLQPGLPIVLCSGHPGILPKQTDHPASWHWLNKPYPGDQLLTLLARILELAPERDGPPPAQV